MGELPSKRYNSLEYRKTTAVKYRLDHDLTIDSIDEMLLLTSKV